MLKTALLVLGFSTAAATATFVFVGRTVHSSPFQMDIPYGTAVKTTLDPANVWSWHHTFTGGSGTAEVLVDVDGNNVMDTEHAWLRVVITDMEITGVNLSGNSAIAWIRDGAGRRFAVSTNQGSSSPLSQHEAFATPIVLPVGSPLSVEVLAGAPCEVHLIGRVVNL